VAAHGVSSFNDQRCGLHVSRKARGRRAYGFVLSDSRIAHGRCRRRSTSVCSGSLQSHQQARPTGWYRLSGVVLSRVPTYCMHSVRSVRLGGIEEVWSCRLYASERGFRRSVYSRTPYIRLRLLLMLRDIDRGGDHRSKTFVIAQHARHNACILVTVC
jgi:hypothetical protein